MWNIWNRPPGDPALETRQDVLALRKSAKPDYSKPDVARLALCAFSAISELFNTL